MGKQKRPKKISKIEQAFDTNWNIDAYRTTYESDEHWELRRAFMEHHKNRMPEDELVCLAQVFVNMEHLHCRYPPETMQRVKELAEGIPDEYRKSRANALKRTFVAASDAAAAKVQRLDASEQRTVRFGVNQSGQRFSPVTPIKTKADLFHNVIIMNNDYGQTEAMFNRLNIGQLSATTEVTADGQQQTTVRMGRLVIARDTSTNIKTSRKNATEKAMKIFAKHCYALRLKQCPANVSGTKQIARDETIMNGETDQSAPDKNVIQESNVGFQMMLKLGWSGGGLGKKSAGIIEPVRAADCQHRKGLGHAKSNESYFRKLLNNYAKSVSDEYLVFSELFSKEERQIIHTIARKLRLRTRSYGKGDNRKLVVMGAQMQNTAHSILNKILHEKNETFREMYDLFDPSGNQVS